MKTIIVIVLIFLFGCKQDESSNFPVHHDQPIVTTQEDSLKFNVKGIHTESNAITKFLNKPIDFYAFKNNVHLLNSSNFVLGNDFFHKVDDSSYIFYDYWVIGLDSTNDRSLSFKVLKPWSSPRDRYYSSNNELLIGIKSKIPCDALELSNFVGKSEDQIIKQLGNPNFVEKECLIYYQNDKLLILKSNHQKVSWFKYIWLEKDFELLNEIPDELYQW